MMKIPKIIHYLSLIVTCAWVSGCNLPARIGLVKATPEIPSTAVVNEIFTPTVSSSPTSTITATSLPTATPEPVSGSWMAGVEKLAIVYLDKDRSLGVYSQPGGTSQNQVGELIPGASEIIPNGKYEWRDKVLWLEIYIQNENTGWIDARYLTSPVDSEYFCADSRVLELISQVKNSFEARDGKQLSRLTSPLHGLAIKHEWWNPTIIYEPGVDIEKIFSDQKSITWGIQDGSGLPLLGSFQDLIYPSIMDVLPNYSLQCNTLEQGLAAGGTTGFVQWPFEFLDINYYSLYRTAPEGDELNWRTWAMGIEYLQDIPYLAVLVQYHWEI